MADEEGWLWKVGRDPWAVLCHRLAVTFLLIISFLPMLLYAFLVYFSHQLKVVMKGFIISYGGTLFFSLTAFPCSVREYLFRLHLIQSVCKSISRERVAFSYQFHC